MKRLYTKIFMAAMILTILSGDLSAQTRIRFARGRTSATVSGTIAGYGSRTYILGARYGQYLSANVSSRNDCIVFSSGATNTSYVTNQGSNHLYLRNRCGRQVGFSLTVSINYGSD